MTKQIRIRLSLLTLLLVLLSALPALAGEGRTYTIKKGDTLWGISERFISDPYYWPNLWANNPFIANPHLIYPGQKVQIYDGRIKIIPAYPGTPPAPVQPPAAAPEPAPQPQVTEAPPEVASEPVPEPVPETLIKTSGGGEGFILAGEESVGTIVDSIDNRVLLTQNDLVFLQMKATDQVAVGDTYGLYTRGREVLHPATQEPVGTMMHDLGFLQVSNIDNGMITARIGEVFREVERGAELYEYLPPVKEVSLQQAEGELAGYIVAAQEGKITQGQNDVIFVDLGREDGLEVGNLFYITRSRQVTEQAIIDKQVIRLPDEVLGAAVVIETRPRTASAIIVKSVKTIFVGDRVLTATE